MEHEIIGRTVFAQCTNSECSTDRIVDDLIECPDCGENKVHLHHIDAVVEPDEPKHTSQNRPMSFAVCLHDVRRGVIVSTRYVNEPSQMVDVLEQCSLNHNVSADIVWVTNFAEYVNLCNSMAGVDMNHSKYN